MSLTEIAFGRVQLFSEAKFNLDLVFQQLCLPRDKKKQV